MATTYDVWDWWGRRVIVGAQEMRNKGLPTTSKWKRHINESNSHWNVRVHMVVRWLIRVD